MIRANTVSAGGQGGFDGVFDACKKAVENAGANLHEFKDYDAKVHFTDGGYVIDSGYAYIWTKFSISEGTYYLATTDTNNNALPNPISSGTGRISIFTDDPTNIFFFSSTMMQSNDQLAVGNYEVFGCFRIAS